MSLDINLIIILVVSAALVLDVLTIVVHVFQNCWTFEKPGARTYLVNASREFAPGAYIDVWTTEVIGAVKKNNSQRLVNPLPPPSAQRPYSPPGTRPSGRQLIPSDNLFYRSVAWMSPQMSTFASRAATSKLERDVGSPETSALSPTRFGPTTATNSATKTDLATLRVKILGANPEPRLSGSSISHKLKTKIRDNTLASTSLSAIITYNSGATRTTTLSATMKALEVSAVKKSQVPTYSSLPSTESVSTRVIARASPRVDAEDQVNGGGDRVQILRPSKGSKTPVRVARNPEHSMATASHGLNSTNTSTSASKLESSIPSGSVVGNKENSAKVGIETAYHGVDDVVVPNNPPVSGIAHLEPEARLEQTTRPVPAFVPPTEPVRIVPAKRRLWAGANKVVRPTKRRRLAYPEEKSTPLTNPASAEVPSALDATTERSCVNISTPISALTPTSNPTPDTASTSASSPASDIPTTAIEPTIWQNEKYTDSIYRINEPNDTPTFRIVVSDTAHPESNMHTLKESHFTPFPSVPTPPKSIIPAKRRSPVKFSKACQTKRRRSVQAETEELHTPLPSTNLANFQPPSPVTFQQQLIHPQDIPAINDSPLPSEPVPCSSNQLMSQYFLTRASDMITHLTELTQGRIKRTRTSTSDKATSLMTSALGPMIDTIMSSSGKPGAPPRVCLSAPVVSRASVGEGSNDVNMAVLDTMATPDITMASSTADNSTSSTDSAPVSPMDLELVGALETRAKAPEDHGLDDGEDVEMDPDSLMDDDSRSGFIQNCMPTASDQSATTQATSTLEDTVPIEEASTGIAPEEIMEDAVDQGGQGNQGVQEGESELVEELINAPIGPAGGAQQSTSLVQAFADMQVGSVAEDGVDRPNPEMEPMGEHLADTQAATIPQTLEPEPVTGLAQASSDLQATSACGESEAHPGVPNGSTTLPTEQVADLAQSLAGMQVGTSASAEAAESTTLGSHPAAPDEYVEDPFDALIQGLVITHLPAPVIVPYEPEAIDIGVDNTVAGPTGSDFISLGFGNDEEEEESGGEERVGFYGCSCGPLD
ncbi:hypothetical protein B0J17DRAFT_116412 [Rhizoctonia solani]|nr:hypothetical protein B0J17DRAFT_116412 [Rhizoctonia solani]